MIEEQADEKKKIDFEIARLQEDLMYTHQKFEEL